MRLRALQSVFVALSLLSAFLILRQNRAFFAAPARAQPAGTQPARTADRTAAIAAIRAQLRAFQRNDFQKASQYQSQGLRAHFPTPDSFRRMMQTTYPAFLTFRSVTFGSAETPDGGRHLLMPVALHEGNGGTVWALYIMVREGKAYRVDGVEGGMASPTNVVPMPNQIT